MTDLEALEGQYPTGSERYFADKHDRLKYKFFGSEDIVENHSQSMQDMFVLSVLDGKKNGTYVEIGADRPRVINNTWLLESMYDWKGVSFEIDPIKVDYFNTIRQNKCKLIEIDEFFFEFLKFHEF